MLFFVLTYYAMVKLNLIASDIYLAAVLRITYLWLAFDDFKKNIINYKLYDQR